MLTEIDACISQDIIDLTIPTKCPKIFPDSDSPSVSEQLHLLTTPVDQLRLTSEQALAQKKPLIQTFPLANFKQFPHLHAVQQQVAHFFVDLKTEKSERLKLYTTIRRLEDQLTQLRRQVNEPSPSSLPVPFTVDPPCSAAFLDSSAPGNIQITRPRVTVTLKRITTSRSRRTEPPRSPPSTQTTFGPSSVLDTRVRQLEEELTKAENCRETIISIYRSQFTFHHDKFPALESGGSDTILWKVNALRLVFGTPNLLPDLTMLPRTPVLIITVLYTAHTLMAITSLFNSIHMVRTLPQEITPQSCSPFFPGDYDGLLAWPFPKTFHLSVRDQLDPQNKWTITLAPSKKISFRRPTREPCPTLTNSNFFPHSKMFSKTENFLLNNTLYLKKITDLPNPERAIPSSSKPWCFLLNPPLIFLSL